MGPWKSVVHSNSRNTFRISLAHKCHTQYTFGTLESYTTNSNKMPNICVHIICTVQKFSFHILCGYMNYFMKIRFLHSYQFRTEDFLFMFESTESNIELSTFCDECDIDVIRTSFGVFRIFIGVQHLHFIYILNWTVHSIPLFWYQLQLQCGQLTQIGRLMIQMSKVL